MEIMVVNRNVLFLGALAGSPRCSTTFCKSDADVDGCIMLPALYGTQLLSGDLYQWHSLNTSRLGV